MIESSKAFISSCITLQQRMESKTYLSCQSFKNRPGMTTDQPWLPNKSQWRAALALLFIIFDGICVSSDESRCHQSTWWNGGAEPITAAFVSHLNTPGSVWKSHAWSRPWHKIREAAHRWQSIMTTLRIVGQQLLQFDQSLILAYLTPIKPTFTAHVPPLATLN